MNWGRINQAKKTECADRRAAPALERTVTQNHRGTRWQHLAACALALAVTSVSADEAYDNAASDSKTDFSFSASFRSDTA
ncbi:MAG: hypothetical protein Q8Q73_02145, partial [Stagnimonas sp.]|nr:hypothetical protein [Stagnimonas sp.]